MRLAPREACSFGVLSRDLLASFSGSPAFKLLLRKCPGHCLQQSKSPIARRAKLVYPLRGSIRGNDKIQLAPDL